MIICEGKTDVIYLKHAIRSLQKDYPDLLEDDGHGKKKIRLLFFRYNEHNQRLLKLGGGIPPIKHFIGAYHKEFGQFKSPDKAPHPVMIVCDNDDASKKILGAVKNASGKTETVNGDNPFYHVKDNLYLCPIPKRDDKNTVIEDYFPEEVLKTEINGKKFNKANKNIDKDKEYGKAVFATKVVAKKWREINFNAFKPILDNIQAAIKACEK